MGEGRDGSINKYLDTLSIVGLFSPKLNIKCNVLLSLFRRSFSEQK